MTESEFDPPATGDLEPVDEVRLHPASSPAPVPLEPGDLPSSYGDNSLVLLPVDPYLVYVYWDLASSAPPAPGAHPILRFHESDGALHTRPFDVDVNLAASNWYVHLWSPDKIYCADLGWQAAGGSFTPLVRSNTVRTPPAWPRPTGPVKTPAPPAIAAAPPADAETCLQARLSELFANRPDPFLSEVVDFPFGASFEAEQEIPGEPSQLDAPIPPPNFELPEGSRPQDDLTQYSEERFTPGVSSTRDPLGE